METMMDEMRILTLLEDEGERLLRLAYGSNIAEPLHRGFIAHLRAAAKAIRTLDAPREFGFYWVKFKRAGDIYGDNAWPWLANDHRHVALYNPAGGAGKDDGSARWFCLGQFRRESEFEIIGPKLPDFAPVGT